MAGITILAIANGGPDIVTTAAAIKMGDFPLALGESVGTGLFTTTFVVFLITLFSPKPVYVERRTLILDATFLLGVIGAILFICYDMKAYLYEAIILVSIYFLYVFSVWFLAHWSRRKSRRKLFDVDTSSFETLLEPEVKKQFRREPVYGGRTGVVPEQEDSAHFDIDFGEDTEGFSVESPEESRLRLESGWVGTFFGQKRLNTYRKLLYPVLFMEVLINLTTPPGKPKHWRRNRALIQCILAPPALILAFSLWQDFGSVPLWPFPLAVGAACFPLVWFFTVPHRAPKYFWCVWVFSVVMSMAWIYFLATEIVDIIGFLGAYFGINTSILGLTVLTWGTSTGDVFAVLIMTRKGFAKMMLAASYGGTLFNLVVGLGLALLLQTAVSYPEPVVTEMTTHLFLGLLSLAFALIVLGIALPLAGYRTTKTLGFTLLFLYLASTTANVILSILNMEIGLLDSLNYKHDHEN